MSHFRLASSSSVPIDEMLDRAVVCGKIIEFIVAGLSTILPL